jgi:hypothetical protein
MKIINSMFECSDDAKFTLINESTLHVHFGTAYAKSGGTAVAWSGGTAYAESGGTAYAELDGEAFAWPSGRAYALLGGMVAAYSGGTAVAYEGGEAYAWSGGTAITESGGTAYQITDCIADDRQYKLFKCNGLYFAGCARFLTKEQALNRWDRHDDRALLFTFAINFFDLDS